MGLPVDGAHILLTGASAGIGWATAETLATMGATLAVTGRRQARLDELLERLAGSGHVAIAGELDDPDTATAIAEEAWRRLGHLDVVVHNAATPMRRPVTAIGPDEIAATMRVNFDAPVRMTLA